MNITLALDYLKDLGYKIDYAEFYREVERWQAWYKGYDNTFHRYAVPDPLSSRQRRRDMYTMKMGVKLPQDMASLLLNERVTFTFGDEAASTFVQGDSGRGGVLGDNNFYMRANQLMERTAALGTGAIVLRIHGAEEIQGELCGGAVRYEYVSMPGIVPLSWESDQITEAAFCSIVYHGGAPHMYIELHTIEDDGYVIRNRYCLMRKDKLVDAPLPEGMSAEIHTHSMLPMFAIFKLNITNQFTTAPFGVSMFANAIDNLKAVDLAFHNFCVDFQLGRKMVFMKQDLMGVILSEDGQRTAVAPQDYEQTLFTYIGTDSDGTSELIHEFNPSLRVDENERGVQAMLNYLSMMTGLGERHYTFDRGAVATATQIISENATLYRNIQKHNILIENSLKAVLRATLWAGKYIVGHGYDELCDIQVVFDDGIVEDKRSLMERDLALYNAGVLDREEFRQKYGIE